MSEDLDELERITESLTPQRPNPADRRGRTAKARCAQRRWLAALERWCSLKFRRRRRYTTAPPSLPTIIAFQDATE